MGAMNDEQPHKGGVRGLRCPPTSGGRSCEPGSLWARTGGLTQRQWAGTVLLHSPMSSTVRNKHFWFINDPIYGISGTVDCTG